MSGSGSELSMMISFVSSGELNGCSLTTYCQGSNGAGSMVAMMLLFGPVIIFPVGRGGSGSAEKFQYGDNFYVFI